MKRVIAFVSVLSVSLSPAAFGQAAVAPPSGKTLAATIDVYVFPTKGQSSQTQSEDEASCYTWATQNVGTDPFALQKQAQQQQQQSAKATQQAQQTGRGAGAAGAVGGAAAGALIGEIAGHDAGAAAGWGAAAGALIARRRAREAREHATEQAQSQGQQAQHATQEQIDNFKKAFSVCLEAKNYMVKY